jgi:hypothetical protein
MDLNVLRPVVGRSVVSTTQGIVAASHPRAARAGLRAVLTAAAPQQRSNI